MDGERIGPYRLEARLGVGGMGEVWEAWDERLERRVAIKRVRPGNGADPASRERLRREARAAARLSHPAIVQVHDLVETADGDWIVMERVEGRPLDALLRDGPLGLARVLPLARQIAAGLAEAHGRGLLHRDLKAENIVVTPAGQAKILDFGLAKPYWPAAGLSGDPALTAAGAVAGTHRAMSPEQANGQELDPRSDLFSFGTLLYEMVTGVSPFAGGSPVETLHRVCTLQQRPAAALQPGIPAALSELIDQLLEKSRSRRPAGAAEVAQRLAAIEEPRPAPSAPEETIVGPAPAGRVSSPSYAPLTGRRARWLALVALLFGLAAAAGTAVWVARPQEPRVVAVPAPEIGVGAGRPETALAAAGLHAALQRGLLGFDGLAALVPDPRSTAEPDGHPATLPASPPAIARSLAADEVLASRLDCQGPVCKVSLRRLQGGDGRVLWVEVFEAPGDDFPLLGTAVEAALRRGYPGWRRRAGAAELDVKREDFARYLRLDQAVAANDPAAEKGALAAQLAEAAAIRRSSPRFLEVYLLEARLASIRFFASREGADLDRALELLAEARRLAPGDPRPLLRLATVTLNAERLDQAEEVIRELDRQIPGDTRTLVARALLLEHRGRRAEALEAMRSAAHLRPSAGNLLDLGNLEYRTGMVDAAQRTLAEGVARFPRDLMLRSRLAQLELQSGSPERAADLYAELVRRAPSFAELSNLGVAELLLGRYDAAAESFRRAFALAPASPAAALNLADAEWLRGRRPEAEALYRRVLELVDRDPAPAFWQNLTTRGQALAHLGRKQEAVAAVQQALTAAGGNPQVSYEASLVYAVVGDTASAEVNAKRALAGGYDRRWFRFPWFSGLSGL